MFSLKLEVALVTGSSRGLGFELGKSLSSAGACALVNGCDVAQVPRSVDELGNPGLDAPDCAFDVRDLNATASAAEGVWGLA